MQCEYQRNRNKKKKNEFNERQRVQLKIGHSTWERLNVKNVLCVLVLLVLLLSLATLQSAGLKLRAIFVTIADSLVAQRLLGLFRFAILYVKSPIE